MKWKKYTWFLAFTIGRCIENRQFFVYFWNIDIWAIVVWLQHIYIQYRAGGKKKKMSAHSILASHSFCIYEFSKSSYHELYIWNYSSCIIFNLSFHVMCRKGIAIWTGVQNGSFSFSLNAQFSRITMCAKTPSNSISSLDVIYAGGNVLVKLVIHSVLIATINMAYFGVR